MASPPCSISAFRRRREETDRAGYFVSGRIAQQADDRRIGPPVRRRGSAEARRSARALCCRGCRYRRPTGSRPAFARPFSGLPDDAPPSPTAACGPASRPANHWSLFQHRIRFFGNCSNISAGSRSAICSRERLLGALGMTPQPRRNRRGPSGRYAQGYEAADRLVPFVRGARLVPAPWVDVTFGAGSVASTGADMVC